MIGKTRWGAGLFALACALVSIVACSAANRSPDVAFTEKKCGTLSSAREPDPPVPVRSTALSGSAARLPDGSLRVVVNPIVDIKAQTTATSLVASDLAVQVDGKVITDFRIDTPRPDAKVATDIVFVIDTTGSMFWAIDGVRKGINAFVDTVAEVGLDARVGGVEFGDEVRSSQALADTETFKTWVGKLGVASGGDGPENPLDAALSAWGRMQFRPGAQRVVIFITDIGFHEATDKTGCADANLVALRDKLIGRAWVGVVHASLGGEVQGVHPRRLADSVGGLYVGVDGGKVLVSFNVSTDTPLDDALTSTHVLAIPASELPSASPSKVSLVYKGGASDAVSLPIETATSPAPVADAGSDAAPLDSGSDAAPADAGAD